VGARAGHERDETLDELVRREHKRGRAVAPGALELELQAAVVKAGEMIRGDRRSREIARHPLETRAIGGGNAGGRLEVEAADLGAEPAEYDGVHFGGLTSNANNIPTPSGAGRDDTPDRGAGKGAPSFGALLEAALRRSRLAPGDLAVDAATDLGGTWATSSSCGAGVGWKTGFEPAGRTYTPSRNSVWKCGLAPRAELKR
jgi:hypothetical protein